MVVCAEIPLDILVVCVSTSAYYVAPVGVPVSCSLSVSEPSGVPVVVVVVFPVGGVLSPAFWDVV